MSPVLALSLALGCGDKDAPAKDSDTPAASQAEAGKAGAKKPGKTGDGPKLASDGTVLPTPQALFDGHVEAAGGRAAIEAIKSLYVASDLEITGQNLHGKAEVWWRAPGSFYTRETIPGLGVTQAGSDGTQYWADDPVSQLRELDGVEAEQYRWISSVFLPAEWQRFFDEAETSKKREVEGRTFYDVELKTPLGQRVGISFDAQSKLMASQRFKQLGPTGAVPLEVELTDYKPVGGYMMPHRLETRISIATAVQTYTKVKVNAEVDEELFAMPKPSEVVNLDPNLQAPAELGSGKGRRKRQK